METRMGVKQLQAKEGQEGWQTLEARRECASANTSILGLYSPEVWENKNKNKNKIRI